MKRLQVVYLKGCEDIGYISNIDNDKVEPGCVELVMFDRHKYKDRLVLPKEAVEVIRESWCFASNCNIYILNSVRLVVIWKVGWDIKRVNSLLFYCFKRALNIIIRILLHKKREKTIHNLSLFLVIQPFEIPFEAPLNCNTSWNKAYLPLWYTP